MLLETREMKSEMGEEPVQQESGGSLAVGQMDTTGSQVTETSQTSEPSSIQPPAPRATEPPPTAMQSVLEPPQSPEPAAAEPQHTQPPLNYELPSPYPVQPVPPVTMVHQHLQQAMQKKLRQYSRLQTKSVWGLSVGQLITGALSIVCGIIIIVSTRHSESGYMTANSYLGTGLWVGTALVVTGVFGMCAAKRNTFCMIFTSMVFNLVTVHFVVVLLFITAPSVARNSPPCYLGSVYYRARYEPDDCFIDDHLLLATESTMLVIGITQIVTTVICSAIGFSIVCCKYARPNRPMVQYHTMRTTPGMVYPTNGVHDSLPPYSQNDYFTGRNYPVQWETALQQRVISTPTTSNSFSQSGVVPGLPYEKPPQYEVIANHV